LNDNQEDGDAQQVKNNEAVNFSKFRYWQLPKKMATLFV